MQTEPEDRIFAIHAAFCRVFSNEKRLKIMWLLADQELNVGQIAEALGVSMANASQHLRIMRDQGAVRVRREGQTTWYTVANPNFSRGARLIRQGLIEEQRIQPVVADHASTPAAEHRSAK